MLVQIMKTIQNIMMEHLGQLVHALITGRFSAGVAGTQNSSLVFGGQTPT